MSYSYMRPDTTPRSWAWTIPIVLAVVSLLLSGYIGYTHNDKALAVEIGTVKNQQKNDGERLDRMEGKIDRILERLR